MAHIRNRHLEQNLKKLMAHSPLVGLLGHRQVGKTTLLEKLCSKYHVLDLKSEFDLAEQDPENYLKLRAGSWVALDECQSVPSLFPALKEWVRKNKRPGQFILSGSVRFTSREAIKESLTGRILNCELLPMSVPELEQDVLPNRILELLKSEDLTSFTHQHPLLTSSVKKVHQRMHQYFIQGGLPGVCFIRDSKTRDSKFKDQLLTMLDRDLRLVKKIALPYIDILKIVEALARMQGEPVDYSRLKVETGISTPTLKKIMYCLEAIFLIRRVPISGSTQGFTIYFEDQGEQTYLLDRNSTIFEKLSHFAYTNLRPQFEYQLASQVKTFQYRTRGGAFMPICFSSQQNAIGILPIENYEDVERHLGSANSFLGAFSRGKVLFVHPDDGPLKVIKGRILSLPIGYLLS